MKTYLLVGLMSAGLMASASSAIIQFDLQGQAGAGLLPGNELHVVTGGGMGGELGAGISFNDSTNILSIIVGWGSGNGFVNLSGVATAAHLHGPANQTTAASVLVPLTISNTSASNGGITQNIIIGSGDVADLLAGNVYLNVHTGANPGGEIRGNLVQVPEPSGMLLCAAGLLLFLRRRR
ncbi:MAG: CHRD domain-containing protein [Verrucomicrobia bacterium]|nr:CHRD domain-containing protein [Verrucomicrobiota bacterium]